MAASVVCGELQHAGALPESYEAQAQPPSLSNLNGQA
jgi:hypothetical protein